jgi:hypothetical protein
MLSKLPKHESEIPRKGAVDFAANLRKLVEYQQQLVEQLNSNVDAYNNLAKEVSDVEVKSYDEQINSLASSIRKINGKLSNLQNYDDKNLRSKIKEIESRIPEQYSDAEVKKRLVKLESKEDVDLKPISDRVKNLETAEPYKYNDSEIKKRLKLLEEKEINLSPIIERIKAIESKPEFDPSQINKSIKELSERKGYDDSEIKRKIEFLESKLGYDDTEVKSLINTYSKRCDSDMKTYFQLFESEVKKRDSVIDELTKSVKSMAGQISELQSVIMGETE